MKSVKCENTTTYPGIHGSSNKISKPKKDVENEEIQVYLSKLKELVPFMPKNRRLSKLEVIQYVIDYICDLQYALDNHPSINSSAVQSAAAVMLCSHSQSNSSLPIVTPVQRQPLGVLTPNANVAVKSENLNSSSDSSPVSSSRQHEKVSSSTDSKAVC